MPSRRRPARGLLAVAAVAVVALAACTSGSGVGAAPTPAGTPTATSTSTSSATSSTASTPAPSMTPVETPTGTARPSRPAVTAAALKKALLELDDLPPGFSVEPMEQGDANPTISSKRAQCKALVDIMNADHAPGAVASAATSFSGGQDGPWIDEYLDAVGSAAKVRALHDSITAAVQACPSVTFRLPEGRSTMTVRAVKAPRAGDHSVAFRVTADGGALDGMEATQVATAIDDVELTMIFFDAYPEEIDGGTRTAAAKVREELGGSASMKS